jgi:predicted DNA-binding protein
MTDTLNPAVLTETLSVRLPLDFIKALTAAASAKNVTLSHYVRNILEKSTPATPGA